MRSTLLFLLWPVGMMAMVKILFAAADIHTPIQVLYAFGAIYGLALFVHTMKDPEWLVAITMVYLPFSVMFKIGVAPGINGTNMLVLLMLFALVRRRSVDGTPMFRALPLTAAMGWWAFFGVVSVGTAIVGLGIPHVLDRFTDVKSWFDQFFVFFTVINLIRDGKMARRVAVYMMFGTVLVLLMGFEEWFEKREANSLDKARLNGPMGQPNSFGAFLVYAIGPFLAVFINNLTRPRAWVLLPLLAVFARVLIASFSRGAYLGMGMAVAALGYARGKVFVACAAAALVGLVVAVPEVVPESMASRLGIGSKEDIENPKIDTSSLHRLILWKAAQDMIIDHPVLGVGFGGFPVLKGFYTETEVHESDNHNMYLFVATQFGTVGLLALLVVLLRGFWLSLRLARDANEPFARALGMGACATVAGALVINIFGSRLVDLCVMGYIWMTFAVISHITVEQRQIAAEAERVRLAERANMPRKRMSP
ncbi:MAG: hypothetical protein RLZZ618_3077 [Pseudomonadota bacterium]